MFLVLSHYLALTLVTNKFQLPLTLALPTSKLNRRAGNFTTRLLSRMAN